MVAPFKAAEGIISGIIGGIASSINGLLNKITGFPGAIAKKLNPFKFAGGPVAAGTTYTVGEIGPELYVPGNGGEPYMIGEHGMEDRMFPSSGTIVPSFMLDTFKRLQQTMERDGENMSRELQPAGRGGDTYNEYNYEVNVGVHGTTEKPLTEYDIEKAVEKAIKKADKDKRERR
jgi:hypothetical protein